MTSDQRGGAFGPGSLVIAHFRDPIEKYWGVLSGLDASGVVLRGLGVGAFDEWMYQVVRGANEPLGLTTIFVPMTRVERLDLDEQVGEVESYRQRFERHVGRSIESWLGLPDV